MHYKPAKLIETLIATTIFLGIIFVAIFLTVDLSKNSSTNNKIKELKRCSNNLSDIIKNQFETSAKFFVIENTEDSLLIREISQKGNSGEFAGLLLINDKGDRVSAVYKKGDDYLYLSKQNFKFVEDNMLLDNYFEGKAQSLLGDECAISDSNQNPFSIKYVSSKKEIFELNIEEPIYSSEIKDLVSLMSIKALNAKI